MTNDGLRLVAPRITPVLDPMFRPASLANRAFREELAHCEGCVPVGIAVEQADGSIFRRNTAVFPEEHPAARGNFRYLERLIKFLLWSRGGYRVHFDGPRELHSRLAAYYKETPAGKFDAEIMGGRIYERRFDIVHAAELPPPKESSAPLGRHLDGCRIGFDLGGSDRKVAAVQDGKPIFSEEIVWNPIPEKNPQWHYDEINDSLKRAAAHLPRVDAIGGSAAGVYVNNRVKVASLFRGVPPDLFQTRVKDMFLELGKEWGVPFEIANDGEVTALAGSMALGENGVFGLALGTSTAAGYVTLEGNITTWLNELAFAPIDYNAAAPVDEWSGDYGCGVQYFSQQAVGRLIPVAGIHEIDAALPLPEKLKEVQRLMDQGDYRARKIYETIGVYLGYAIGHYAEFYDIRHVLILGRVTTGAGADIILNNAREVLKLEFPELAQVMEFHVPDEKEKRHGQAIAAASLPVIRK